MVMRLPRFALVLALALVACAPPPQTPHSKASAQLERETVALVAASPSGPRAYCSGVWVGPAEILTANHCTADFDVGDQVAYVTRDDLLVESADEVATIRFGKLVARDVAHDLALLRVVLAPSHESAGVGTPEVGEAVQTMGHPLGLWWSYSQGVVASIRVVDWDDGPMWVVQSTAPISPGNSGGGLFDDAGNLLGICHGYYPRGENVNFYIDARYVRVFLDQMGVR